jgi:hypothetical protein
MHLTYQNEDSKSMSDRTTLAESDLTPEAILNGASDAEIAADLTDEMFEAGAEAMVFPYDDGPPGAVGAYAAYMAIERLRRAAVLKREQEASRLLSR